MKAYLFIETGDTRSPKQGEWFHDEYGEFSFCDNAEYERELIYEINHPIFTRHEIEIPDNVDSFHYWFSNAKFTGIRTGCFPIPRKKKVKKWIWKCGNIWYTNEHFSEAEIKKRSNMICLSKVDGTEIEVEE